MKAVLSHSLQGEYAGFISRAMAIVLDIFLANIVIIAVAVGAQWILGFFTFGGYFSDGDRLSDMGQLVLNLIVGVTMFTMTNLYPMVFWMLTGQTIGKAVMGLRVVQIQGKPITFSVALRRLVGYYLSALFLFLGFLWVFVDDRRQGWHDKLAGTCVVYSWNAHGSDRLSENFAKHISISQT
jgi:uncharacterized RDD family membrane protein YckC